MTQRTLPVSRTYTGCPLKSYFQISCVFPVFFLCQFQKFVTISYSKLNLKHLKILRHIHWALVCYAFPIFFHCGPAKSNKLFLRSSKKKLITFRRPTMEKYPPNTLLRPHFNLLKTRMEPKKFPEQNSGKEKQEKGIILK